MNSLQQSNSSLCGNCGIKDRLLLHSVRHRGEFRQLCTSCVLKLHPSFFCPICFQIFDQPPPSHERVICQKCPSITHPGCVPPGMDSLNGSTYLCPPCANPGFSFLNVKRHGGRGVEIDLQASKVLLCAASIAVLSMSRAVFSAESDAKRKVKEAAESKKKARMALEEVFEMYAKEKVAQRIKKQASGGGGASASSSVVNGSGSGSGIEMNGAGLGVGIGSMNGLGFGVGVGVGSSSVKERVGIAVGSGAGGIGSSGSFGVQNRVVGGAGMTMGNRGVVLGSNVVRIDDRKGAFSNGNGSVVRPVNLSNAGNASHAGGGNGLTSARPADDGQGRQ